MLTGFAAMGIKYNKGKFEVSLTNVETDDVLDLLSFDAQPVRFKISKASESPDGGYQEEPETGRMFDSHAGVVENVRPAGPQEVPAVNEVGVIIEEEKECLCETCTHLLSSDSLDENDEPKRECELENCNYEAIPETEPTEVDTQEDSEEPHLTEIQFIERAEEEAVPTEESIEGINLDATPN